NALRRPGRLALSLGLLAAGGAMAMTAIQVERGWAANVAKVYATRRYDVEVVLNEPAPRAVGERLSRLPGLRGAELWGYAPAAFSRPGELDVSHVYPDRGHGSLFAMGIPPETGLVHFPLRAGRWLRPEDRGTDALVLNHAAARASGRQVGDPVTVSIGGRPTSWHVVGIVEEIGAAGVVYAADASFDAATGATAGGRLLRVTTGATTPAAQASAIQAIEGALGEAGASVQSVMPLAELRTAMGDHVLVLVRMLEAMAGILGLVGLLGLVSTLSVSVVERTRELAVMKTLGATPARLARLLLAEALAIAGLAYVAGVILSVPLTLLVDRIVGSLGFLAPLPLVLSPAAAGAWLALGAVGTVIATVIPARRAAALSIREGMGRT
ncbi:MAG TPA: FtsX-like permease family protein, partial [Anaeromyxobacteraceae bacterium]|nr:FtsX-like permease family protein [Anaeromyxobacteraceae bacterium]